MENRAHALAAGLFILGLLIAIALVGNEIAGQKEARRAYRVVSTQPVTGLNPQGQVRYRGLSVGRVKSIMVDDADTTRMLVVIEVQESLKLTRGTYAQLGMEGITGISYVHLLDDGKDRTPLPADGVPDIVLKPSMLDELFDSAGGVTNSVKEAIASVQKVLDAENRENIAAALASLRTVTANLEVASRRLPGTLERADGFLSEQNRRNVSDTLASVQASARDMPELARDAKAIVVEARRLVESVNTLTLEVRGTALDLRHETLPRANALAESVERGAERIGRLAYELERRPESVLWGRPPSRPGPGEAGFE